MTEPVFSIATAFTAIFKLILDLAVSIGGVIKADPLLLLPIGLGLISFGVGLWDRLGPRRL